MGENSNIEWTHHTFNPWIGCTKVGPGCDHCYAEVWDSRGLQQKETRWGPHAARTRTSAANWRKPLAWDKAAAAAGARHRVFCASLADVFDNHASILPEWRADLWALIKATPNLDWMLLTKRPGNIAKKLPSSWGYGWHNVWLGCTVVNQEEAERDVPKLLAVPARVRFLSMEPLLGPVDLTAIPHGYPIGNAPTYQDALRGKLWMPAGTPTWAIDPRATVGDRTYVDLCAALALVIVSGESGPGARPMHPDWPRQIRDQCVAAGTALFFKQWGEWKPLSQTEFGEDDAYYHPAPESDPEASRRCKHDSLCLAPDGTSFSMGSAQQYHKIEDGAFRGAGHMSCFKVGKKAAGRLLDGRTWDQMPGVRND